MINSPAGKATLFQIYTRTLQLAWFDQSPAFAPSISLYYSPNPNAPEKYSASLFRTGNQPSVQQGCIIAVVMQQGSSPALSKNELGIHSQRRRVLFSLTVCHTLNDILNIVISPLIPLLRQTFGLTFSQAGVLPFLSLALSSVLQPTLGYLADRRRARTNLMGIGFIFMSLGMVLMGSANGYVVLLLAMIVIGIGASTYHPQSATFIAHYFKGERGKAQGIHGIGNGVAFILAPLIVTRLGQDLGFRPVVFLMAFFGIVGALIIWTQLKEPATIGSRGLWAGVNQSLIVLMIVNGLSIGVHTGVLTWLPSFYFDRVDNLFTAGSLTAAMSVSTLIAQPVGGRVSDLIGRRNVLFISVLGTSVSLALFVAVPTLANALGVASVSVDTSVFGDLPLVVLMMVPFTILFGFWGSLMPPVTMVYASELASGERSGMAVGIVWGMGTALASVFPLITGVMIENWGFELTFLMLVFVGPVIALITALLPRA